MAESTDKDVRAATNRAELCEDLSHTLNDMPIADRVQLAHLVSVQNMQDRLDNETLPQVIFNFGAEEDNGKMHLLEGWCVRDPSAFFFRGVKSIYQMPSGIDVLPRDDWRMRADSRDEEIRLRK